MVNTNEQKFNSFTPVKASYELVLYVLHILDNKKNFPLYEADDNTDEKHYSYANDFLINKARTLAYEIYMCTSTANKINAAESEENAKTRLSKQAYAITLCNEFLQLLVILQKRFHIEMSRIKYWGKLIVEAKSCIEKWHNSDKVRYKT